MVPTIRHGALSARLRSFGRRAEHGPIDRFPCDTRTGRWHRHSPGRHRFGGMFPPAERAKWMGLFGVVYGFSSLFGPTLGGWLTEHGPLLGSLVTESTRWRWVFYINLPVGLIAVLTLLIFLPSNLSVPT